MCAENSMVDRYGEVVGFSRKCLGRVECEMASDLTMSQCSGGVPAAEQLPVMKRSTNLKLQAGQRARREEVVDTIACTACEDASCLECPMDQPLHCLKCGAFSEAACWVSGDYEKCQSGDVCSKKVTTQPSGRVHIARGCTPMKNCPAGSFGADGNAMSCDKTTGACIHCGVAEPEQAFSDDKQASMCGAPAYSTCMCKGDPHCSTFDSAKIPDLPGTCWHTFARDGCTGGLPSSGKPEMNIEIQLDSVGGNHIAVQKVRVTYGSRVVVMGAKPTECTVDDVTMDFTETQQIMPNMNVTLSTSNPKTVKMMLPNGVVVEWDFDRQVSAHAPPSLQKKMCGVCGDYDSNPENDYAYGPTKAAMAVCPGKSGVLKSVSGGEPASNEKTFAYSWVSSVPEDDAVCKSECGL